MIFIDETTLILTGLRAIRLIMIPMVSYSFTEHDRMMIYAVDLYYDTSWAAKPLILVIYLIYRSR